MMKLCRRLKWIGIVCAVLVIGGGAIKRRKNNDFSDKVLWKKQYEDELTESILATGKKEGNKTKLSNVRSNDNDEVIEKLMETIISSEKYLRKVESIDFRLNRLDIEMHEKTNTIIKYLVDMSKPLGSQNVEKLDGFMETLRNEISQLKYLTQKEPAHTEADSVLNANLDSRISFLESGLKHVISSVDGIMATIAEVKNRQHSRTDINFKSIDDGGSPVDVSSLINEFRRTLVEQRMQKKCDHSLMGSRSRVERAEKYPTDCHEIQVQGFNVSGIYKIKPDDTDPFYVLCDLTTAGGGWTVFQNRFDGSQDFYKTWTDYKYGFGNLAAEFWLGLEKLHYLTNQKLYELRVELESQHGQEAYAGYSVYTVGPEYEGYRISTLGTYYGTAGDSLSYHAGQKFSTYDIDNDEWKDGSCAAEHGGAWWYKECDKSNLNGKYVVQADEHSRGQSMYWISFKGPNFPLLKTKMMIRPLPASRPNYFSDASRVKAKQIIKNTNIKNSLVHKNLEGPKLGRASDVSSAKSIKSKSASYDLNHGSYRYEDPFFASNY